MKRSNKNKYKYKYSNNNNNNNSSSSSHFSPFTTTTTPPPGHPDLPPLTITYTNDPKTITNWIARNNDPYLGFDTESVPGGQGYDPSLTSTPSTLQLCSSTTCLLIHLSSLPPPLLPPSLTALLNSSAPLKIGCAITDDSLDLHSYSPSISLTSRLDLGGLSGSTVRPVGLKNVTKAILDYDIPKNRKIMLSDWSAKLSQSQLEYACRDAWAGYAVFVALKEMYPSIFNDERILEIMEKEINVHELKVRFDERKKAKARIKHLKGEGFTYDSSRVKPFREKLNLNRQPQLPIFKGLDIKWPEKLESGEEFKQEEFDIINGVLEEIKNWDSDEITDVEDIDF
ncbi:hypothetical protein TrST_g4709 [Triparma strigata]|uniref:3'-5' exonuclease n=1 Tax=Triparma strigata TaxID=1606541 RepID=A0A9W7E8H6_9STRA|nr:hypothetical protein TrST_g4709 [Triparma strigata]